MEHLHAEIEALQLEPIRAIAAHALVDAGVINKIECMHPECLKPTRKFDQTVFALKLSFDHIEGHEAGHRPTNIRLMHHGCNAQGGAKKLTHDTWVQLGRKSAHLQWHVREGKPCNCDMASWSNG